MLTVHHLNDSRSQRILWMLEELGLEYRIRFYERRADMTAPSRLKQVHPLGQSPSLEDDHEGRNIVGRLAVRRIRPMLDVHLDYVEAELASRPYFAGETLTAADIMMSFPLEAARARARLGASRPAILAWLDRKHARPAYQEALRKGGPYSFA